MQGIVDKLNNRYVIALMVLLFLVALVRRFI